MKISREVLAVLAGAVVGGAGVLAAEGTRPKPPVSAVVASARVAPAPGASAAATGNASVAGTAAVDPSVASPSNPANASPKNPANTSPSDTANPSPHSSADTSPTRSATTSPSNSAITSPTSSANASPSASPPPSPTSRAERLRKAREEMAQRYADRRRDAVKIVADLRACLARTRPGSGRRSVEKAITNIEGGIAKADAQAASGVYRRAFLALGRPEHAAQAALKKCKDGGASGDDGED